MDCDELREKIDEHTDKEKVGRSGTKGLLQRYRDYLGDDIGHVEAYQQNQAALNSYLDAFIDKGCGDPPPNALEWAVKPLPPPPVKDEGSTSDAVVKTAETVGKAYIAYRVIRFLPSLLFPPSIPVNAAVP